MVLACCHLNLLRSESGERLSVGQALFIAFCQIIGASIVLIVVLLILGGLKRLFA